MQAQCPTPLLNISAVSDMGRARRANSRAANATEEVPTLDDLNALLQSLAKPVSYPARPSQVQDARKKSNDAVRKSSRQKKKNQNDRLDGGDTATVSALEDACKAVAIETKHKRQKNASARGANALASTAKLGKVAKARAAKGKRTGSGAKKKATKKSKGLVDTERPEEQERGNVAKKVNFDEGIESRAEIPEPSQTSSDGEEEAKAMIAAVQKIAAERKQSQMRKNLKIDAQHISRMTKIARKAEHDFLTIAAKASNVTAEDTRAIVDQRTEIVTECERLCVAARVRHSFEYFSALQEIVHALGVKLS